MTDSVCECLHRILDPRRCKLLFWIHLFGISFLHDVAHEGKKDFISSFPTEITNVRISGTFVHTLLGNVEDTPNSMQVR